MALLGLPPVAALPWDSGWLLVPFLRTPGGVGLARGSGTLHWAALVVAGGVCPFRVEGIGEREKISTLGQGWEWHVSLSLSLTLPLGRAPGPLTSGAPGCCGPLIHCFTIPHTPSLLPFASTLNPDIFWDPAHRSFTILNQPQTQNLLHLTSSHLL